jgi:hypothetical protein
LEPAVYAGTLERRDPWRILTLHGVVFDIFVLTLPCTAEATPSRVRPSDRQRLVQPRMQKKF